jgi:hypothetical protein
MFVYLLWRPWFSVFAFVLYFNSLCREKRQYFTIVLNGRDISVALNARNITSLKHFTYYRGTLNATVITVVLNAREKNTENN